jgi:hypothetical protein
MSRYLITALALVGAAQQASAQCNAASCGAPCLSCAFSPVDGENPTVDGWRALFLAGSTRTLPGDTPPITDIEVGAGRDRTDAPFPCHLLPAIGATESGTAQFCSGQTIISFDCGFGVMQVTSGAQSYPGLEAREDINMAAGAHILGQKWNSDDSFGGSFGNSDPNILESWYFAVWAYNGFIYRNNPNNPDWQANRPPYRSANSLPRGSYPYPEIVWGYVRNPDVVDGQEIVSPIEVAYPQNIPNQSGLFSVSLALPDGAHEDPCVESCPPEGCPAPELREFVLDDSDAGFTVSGAVETHATGGFADRFFSAAPQTAPSVAAHWQGIATASGVFEVGGFIPRNPATNETIGVVVTGGGRSASFTMNQNIDGGFFATLGSFELRTGETVSVDVTDVTADVDATHRIGLDAFRFRWTGPGTLPPGGEGEGEGDVGGGEGEGEPGRDQVDVLVRGHCGCHATSTHERTLHASMMLLLMAIAVLSRRRPSHRCDS